MLSRTRRSSNDWKATLVGVCPLLHEVGRLRANTFRPLGPSHGEKEEATETSTEHRIVPDHVAWGEAGVHHVSRRQLQSDSAGDVLGSSVRAVFAQMQQVLRVLVQIQPYVVAVVVVHGGREANIVDPSDRSREDACRRRQELQVQGHVPQSQGLA